MTRTRVESRDRAPFAGVATALVPVLFVGLLVLFALAPFAMTILTTLVAGAVVAVLALRSP